MNEVESALKDIENAEFVAVDLEFTGLLKDFRRHRNLSQYFSACVESIPNFLTIQFGLCVASRDESNLNLWCLSPYNFYVFPRDRQIFSGDSRTFEWLHKNGFKFDRWIDEGYDYRRLSLLQLTERDEAYKNAVPENIKTDGLQKLIEGIIYHEKPLVVHNGFLDMLHMYEKFIDELPQTTQKFCSELKRLFTGGIYDTKHLVNEGKYTIFGLTTESSTGLENLRNNLMNKSKHCKFKICDNRMHCGYFLESNDLFHEAGYDALATAQTFILELSFYWIHSKSKHLKNEPNSMLEKNQEINDVSNEDSDDISSFDYIPLNWREKKMYKKFLNIVGVSSVSPGYMNIDKIIEQSQDELNNLDVKDQEEVADEDKKDAFENINVVDLSNNKNDSVNVLCSSMISTCFKKRKRHDYNMVNDANENNHDLCENSLD